MSKLAFPRQYSAKILNKDDEIIDQFWEQEGMTLLEYYAGQALKRIPFWFYSLSIFKPEFTSSLAFDLAETMVKEAEKRQK